MCLGALAALVQRAPRRAAAVDDPCAVFHCAGVATRMLCMVYYSLHSCAVVSLVVQRAPRRAAAGARQERRGRWGANQWTGPIWIAPIVERPSQDLNDTDLGFVVSSICLERSAGHAELD